MSKIKKNRYKGKIFKINTKLRKNIVNEFRNKNFLSGSNLENLSFVIEFSRIFKIKRNNLIDAVRKFKGLKYRQQIIFKNKFFVIVNDSKSTSYSSSIEILKKKNKIYWLVGGVPKKGDKFNLSKKYYKNIKAYIFGKNKEKFSSDLKNKIKIKKFLNLKKAWITLLKDIRKDLAKDKMILFSPAAASFDTFKNFEDRGKYFNQLIKKYKSV
tara:strand:- start:113 stop:748 length:636 start_codon:yes stop_codon:yes gene_type:complete